MPDEVSRSGLLLPALQAQMGDWVYYITAMKMTDIAERVSVAGDIHSSTSLQSVLQRRLTANAEKISKYLQEQPQRFFNALVIGSYGGSPRWLEVDVRSGDNELPSGLRGILGFLELKGPEVLFAIDGQHRVAGIRAALEVEPDLGREEVTTIFLKGVSAKRREDDPEGFQRTRRLFSTLNRYAKPVQKRDIIILDEDDVVAICTRRLLEENGLFAEKTRMGAQKPIHPSDKEHFTTIVALYDCLSIYLKAIHRMLKGEESVDRNWRSFLARRPEEKIVERFHIATEELWEEICRRFPALRELRAADDGATVVGRYRTSTGGHLLFRPIGLEVVVESITRLVKSGWSLEESVLAVSKVPVELDQDPWLGLLWDKVNARMLTASENKAVAWKLLCLGVGGSPDSLRVDEPALVRELAGLTGRNAEEVTLPEFERGK